MKKIIIASAYMLLCMSDYQTSYCQSARIQIVEGRINKVLTIAAPDTLSDPPEFLSFISDVAFVPPNKLYVADTKQTCLYVFDANSGKKLRTIGRNGKGPGEYEGISSVKYDSINGIIVVDNSLRRITILNTMDKVLRTIQLKEEIEDIVFKSPQNALTTYYLLKRDYQPMREVLLDEMKVVHEFGTIVEIQKEMFSLVDRYVKAGHGRYRVFPGGTKIIRLPETNTILFAQQNPYRIVLYNEDRNSEREITRPVPFSTESNYGIEWSNNSASFAHGIKGGLICLERIGSNVMAVIVSKDLQENYLDSYNLKGIFQRRVRIPPLSNPKIHLNRQVVVKTACFGDSKTLYVLMVDWGSLIYWIEKYSLTIG